MDCLLLLRKFMCFFFTDDCRWSEKLWQKLLNLLYIFLCGYRIFVLTGRRGEFFCDCNGDTANFVRKKRGGIIIIIIFQQFGQYTTK